MLQAFSDVPVSPYVDLLDTPRGGLYHRGGPSWPDWDDQVDARHRVAGRRIDTQPPEVTPEYRLDGRWAWCGPVAWHYGHLVADFSMRHFATVAEWPGARIVVTVKPTPLRRTIEDMPDYYRAILAWVGIPEEHVHFATRPCVVDEVVVAPQQEQFRGPGPTPAYLDLMDAETHRRLGDVSRSGVLYVSRAGMPARFAGEGYLEDRLAAVGVMVMRPESLSLHEQMRAYAGAAVAIFAEGSAIHTLQLMGRAMDDVVVLVRRGGLRLAETSIAPRCRSLRYVDVVGLVIHGYDLGGGPADYYGLSVLDEERMLDSFDSLGVSLRRAWSSEGFRRSMEADAREWFAAEASSPRVDVPGSLDLIREKLEAAGLDGVHREVGVHG